MHLKLRERLQNLRMVAALASFLKTPGSLDSVFAVADDETRSRIYKVETIQYGEEGLVDLTLTEAPVDSKLRLLVLDWRDDDFYEYN